MDKQKLIDLLNEDLETEYRSIVQYVTHAATVKGGEFMSALEGIRKHVDQELEHAMTLAEQIDFLGGTPTTTVPKVENQPDPKKALESDLELERHQLERYRERVEQADDMGLQDVAEAIRPILEQTQDHVMDLETVLGR